MRDRKTNRKINKVWDHCNPLGQWYTYGRIGRGKDKLIVTLSFGAGAKYYQI